VAQALLREAALHGVPGLAAPSANRFGRVSPTCAAHVAGEFPPDLLVLDGGDCPVGIESAIVDCSRDRAVLLRPGVLTRAALEAVLAEPLAERDAQAPRASGTLESHYAPRARVRLMDAEALRAALQVLAASAPNPDLPAVAVYSRTVTPDHPGLPFRRQAAQAQAVAHELFAVLRALDDTGAPLIWIETPPVGPEWEGVRDRLQRAAAG
jgi:L-threonylcarbamoyladenylate synthase